MIPGKLSCIQSCKYNPPCVTIAYRRYLCVLMAYDSSYTSLHGVDLFSAKLQKHFQFVFNLSVVYKSDSEVRSSEFVNSCGNWFEDVNQLCWEWSAWSFESYSPCQNLSRINVTKTRVKNCTREFGFHSQKIYSAEHFLTNYTVI